MAERECAVNGKKKDITGGKICEDGHFICKDHAYGRKHCPLCRELLK